MCLTPQYVQLTDLLKTLNLLLPAVLLICLIPLGSAGCPPGQFLHFNPETNIGVCCITRPLPIGYQFISCTVNGTLDRIEKCPKGSYQPDDTTTQSEATCFKPDCNNKDNVEEENCDGSGQNCVITCVCNYEGGYCGQIYYDCKKFPKDCPSELVQRNCSCRRDPTPVRSLPENTSNNPGQTITKLSTTSSDGGYEPTPENDTTNDDGAFDNTNGTTNGTESVPDQTHSTAQNIALPVIAISIILCIGVAVVILAYIFHKRLNKWLSKYKHFCCWNRTTNQDQDSHPLEVLTLGSVVSGPGESSEKEGEPCLSGDSHSLESVVSGPGESSEEEAEPFLSGGGSENISGGQSEGGSNIQSLVVDNDQSEDCNGTLNKAAGGDNDDGSMQAGGVHMQSLVQDTAGSKVCIGDQKNPAGDLDEGDSIQACVSRIQSLVVDQDKRVRRDIETAGPFCNCCGRHQKRCNKRVREQSLARVKPQQGVIGIRQTSQFLEIPRDLESFGYSSFSSSILHDPQSRDSTNTADEETFLKPVSGQETTSSDDQISATGQCINKGTRFENSAELDNEDHMTTSLSNEDPYRTDSHSVVMNYEEEEETVENMEDAE